MNKFTTLAVISAMIVPTSVLAETREDTYLQLVGNCFAKEAVPYATSTEAAGDIATVLMLNCKTRIDDARMALKGSVYLGDTPQHVYAQYDDRVKAKAIEAVIKARQKPGEPALK